MFLLYCPMFESAFWLTFTVLLLQIVYLISGCNSCMQQSIGGYIAMVAIWWTIICLSYPIMIIVEAAFFSHGHASPISALLSCPCHKRICMRIQRRMIGNIRRYYLVAFLCCNFDTGFYIHNAMSCIHLHGHTILDLDNDWRSYVSVSIVSIFSWTSRVHLHSKAPQLRDAPSWPAMMWARILNLRIISTASILAWVLPRLNSLIFFMALGT